MLGTLPPLDELFAVHLGPLILTLLLVRLVRIPPLKFLPIYFLMGLISAGMHLLLLPDASPWWVLAQSLVAAPLVSLVAMGLLGDRLTPINHTSLLGWLGLSPWYLGWEFSLALVLATLLALVAWGLLRQALVLRSMGERMFIPPAQLPGRLRDESPAFQRRTTITFALPMALAALATGLLASIPL